MAERRDGWGKRNGGFWIFWLLCVLEGIAAIVVEGDCVRDCRDLGVHTVGRVG
jgi:hypothetical protein